MKRKAAARLIRLWDSAWEAWQLPPSGAPVSFGAVDPAAAISTNGDTLAVSACHVVAMPVWVDAEDPDVVKTSVELELEVSGFLSRKTAAASSRSLAVEGRTLVTCAVFPQELPEPWGNRIFESYEASPFLAELPEDAVALWVEGEDIVAVFTRGRQAVYWATLDHAESRAGIKRWLEILLLHLTATGVLAGRPRRVAFDGTFSPEGEESLLAGIPEEKTSFPPSLKYAKFSWKPELAMAADRREVSTRKVRQTALALAAFYVVFALVAGLYLGWLGWKAGSLKNQIARLEAATEEFQPVMREWRAIGPSAEPGHFPLEILHLVVGNMPPRGVRLTTYDFGGGKVFVEGEAASATLASEFFAAISRDGALQDIDWKMPTPSLQPNSAARFQLTGVLP